MNANKLIALILSVTTALTLVGCGHEHEWVEATCTEPKTCSICGETEGEALGHTMTKASYQQPATCEVCGETEGEPLPADFEKYDFQLAQLDTTYDCELACYTTQDFNTVAHVTPSDYRIFESDDTHPAKEGYEYRQVTFTVLCDDENTYYYGYRYLSCVENYYDIVGLDESAVYNDDSNTYTVSYNGEPCECTYWAETDPGEWVDQTITGTSVITLQVPVGYDGIVVGIYNSNIEYGEEHIFDIYNPDQFLLFRMA